ncbi:unnamed protein product [Boreogadus saida]
MRAIPQALSAAICLQPQKFNHRGRKDPDVGAGNGLFRLGLGIGSRHHYVRQGRRRVMKLRNSVHAYPEDGLHHLAHLSLLSRCEGAAPEAVRWRCPVGACVSLCGASRLILDYSLQHQGVALLLFTLIHFHGMSPAVEQLWP